MVIRTPAQRRAVMAKMRARVVSSARLDPHASSILVMDNDENILESFLGSHMKEAEEFAKKKTEELKAANPGKDVYVNIFKRVKIADTGLRWG